MVTEQGDLDRVGERFHDMHSKLIATNLTDAERQVLLETSAASETWTTRWPSMARGPTTPRFS